MGPARLALLIVTGALVTPAAAHASADLTESGCPGPACTAVVSWSGGVYTNGLKVQDEGDALFFRSSQDGAWTLPADCTQGVVTNPDEQEAGAAHEVRCPLARYSKLVLNLSAQDPNGLSPLVFLQAPLQHVLVGGGPDGDVVRIYEGFDVEVHGGTGDDILVALAAPEATGLDALRARLFGEDGSDTLHGGPNDDLLDGGAGNDSFIFSGCNPASGPNGGTVGGYGSAFACLVNYEYDLGADTIDGGPGSDTKAYSAFGLGPARTAPVSVTLDGQANDGAAGEGDNVLAVESVTGTTFDDLLVGNAGDNGLTGRGGSDRIDGMQGKDELSGGDGDDHILARDRFVDRISCGAGTDDVSVDEPKPSRDRLFISFAVGDTAETQNPDTNQVGNCERLLGVFALGSLKLTPAAFRAASGGGPATDGGRAGARVAFNADRAGVVRFEIEQRIPGQRSEGGECEDGRGLPPGYIGPPCDAWSEPLRGGDFRRTVGKGRNHFRLTGRVRYRVFDRRVAQRFPRSRFRVVEERLKPGRYRLAARPKDGYPPHTPVRTEFTIKKRG